MCVDYEPFCAVLPFEMKEQYSIVHVSYHGPAGFSLVVRDNLNDNMAIIKHAPCRYRYTEPESRIYYLWFRRIHHFLLRKILAHHPAYSRLRPLHYPTDDFNGYLRRFPPRSTALDQLMIGGDLSVAELVWFALQIADAIHFHATLRIAHLNIKPSNVLVFPGWRIKEINLVDPVIRTLAPVRAHPFYSAPEVRNATPETIDTLDHRADIYSMGMILLSGLAGSEGKRNHLLDGVERLYGSEVRNILAALTHPDRDARPSDPVRSVLELERALVKAGAMGRPRIPQTVMEAILRRDRQALRELVYERIWVAFRDMDYVHRAIQLGEGFAAPFLVAFRKGWAQIARPVRHYDNFPEEDDDEEADEEEPHIEWITEEEIRQMIHFDAVLARDISMIKELRKLAKEQLGSVPTPFRGAPKPEVLAMAMGDRRLARYWRRTCFGRDHLDATEIMIFLYPTAAHLGHGRTLFAWERRAFRENVDAEKMAELLEGSRWVGEPVEMDALYGHTDLLKHLTGVVPDALGHIYPTFFAMPLWDRFLGTDYFLARTKELVPYVKAGDAGSAPGAQGPAVRMKQPPHLIAASIDSVELLDLSLPPDPPREQLIEAFFRAAQKGSINAVMFLMERGVRVNERGPGGRTALMHAAMENRSPMVSFLIDHGMEIDAEDDEGWTGLMVAAQHGHTLLVRELAASGADVNHTARDGSTPLTVAIRNGHVDTVWVLMKYGAVLPDRETIEQLLTRAPNAQALRRVLLGTDSNKRSE